MKRDGATKRRRRVGGVELHLLMAASVCGEDVEAGRWREKEGTFSSDRY